MEQNYKKVFAATIIGSILIGSIFGGAMGFWAGSIASNISFISSLKQAVTGKSDQPPTDMSGKIVKVEEESSVINAVQKVSPAVVSIIISKDLPNIERYNYRPRSNDFFRQFFGDSDLFSIEIPQYVQNGTEKKEVGGGTGFVVSSDGYIVTNKHVVTDETAQYTVLMNDESKHEAKVLARDPVNDLAVLKIEGKSYPYVELGDSSNLKVGQSVIAIGNALGEFRNTVSTGVISGLARSVVAGGIGVGSEELQGVIQTDASINPGNSGGPLLNLAGQVIGINTAMAAGAQNIGFTIPVNEIKNTVDSVRKNGRIIRPWLGVRYLMINKTIAEQNNIKIEEGALIVRGDNNTDLAVIPGSPADKAGLVENDVITEVNGQKINNKNNLANVIGKFKPGDEITLKIYHKGESKDVKVKLEEMK